MEVGDELRGGALQIVEEANLKTIEPFTASGADVVLLSDQESKRWRAVASRSDRP